MLSLNHVSKTFGTNQLFRDINLQLEAGKSYALIGPSGSGKSTLLNLLAKLEPYDGSILYQGRELKTWPSHLFYKQELGYLFQQFGLIEDETIAYNLNLASPYRQAKAQRVLQQKEALEKVGLGYLHLKDRIFTLSGGECQRLALARLLLKKPRLILADEPTASLDQQNAQQVMRLLKQFINPSCLLIVATHQPEVYETLDDLIDLSAFSAKTIV